MQPHGEGFRELRGHTLAWTSLQLHWPLRDFGTGFDVLPFFLSRQWAVAFIDAAGVWDRTPVKRLAPRGSGYAVSIGAELRMGLEVGYVSQGALALGWAYAVGTYDASHFYLRLTP